MKRVKPIVGLTFVLLSCIVNATGKSILLAPTIKSNFAKNDYTPTSSYLSVEINGIEILLSPEVSQNKRLKIRTIERLATQIDSIHKLLPMNKLIGLKPIRIWVEFNARDSGYAEYHAYKQWLLEHRYNPNKYKGIEISNISNYLKWSSEDPIISSVLIHEIAHAYYHSLTSIQKYRVKMVYQEVKNENLYRNVFRLGTRQFGKPVTISHAWALQDEWEYFSELTESIFAKNDYFPHTSKELQKYDQKGFELVKSLWK